MLVVDPNPTFLDNRRALREDNTSCGARGPDASDADARSPLVWFLLLVVRKGLHLNEPLPKNLLSAFFGRQRKLLNSPSPTQLMPGELHIDHLHDMFKAVLSEVGTKVKEQEQLQGQVDHHLMMVLGTGPGCLISRPFRPRLERSESKWPQRFLTHQQLCRELRPLTPCLLCKPVCPADGKQVQGLVDPIHGLSEDAELG